MFFRCEAFGLSLTGPPLHCVRQPDAFDFADFGKTIAAEHEPASFGAFCEIFLLRHVRQLSISPYPWHSLHDGAGRLVLPAQE